MGWRISILAGLLTGLSFGSGTDARADGVAVAQATVIPRETGAEHLKQQLVLLNREFRLRQRAIFLKAEVGLFDDGAVLGRRIAAEIFDDGFRESLAIPGSGVGLLPETTGIGGSGDDARVLGYDLGDLRAEILEIRRRLGQVQDGRMRP